MEKSKTRPNKNDDKKNKDSKKNKDKKQNRKKDKKITKKSQKDKKQQERDAFWDRRLAKLEKKTRKINGKINFILDLLESGDLNLGLGNNQTYSPKLEKVNNSEDSENHSEHENSDEQHSEHENSEKDEEPLDKFFRLKHNVEFGEELPSVDERYLRMFICTLEPDTKQEGYVQFRWAHSLKNNDSGFDAFSIRELKEISGNFEFLDIAIDGKGTLLMEYHGICKDLAQIIMDDGEKIIAHVVDKDTNKTNIYMDLVNHA